MFKKFRLVIVFCIVAVGLLSISCYAGIRIKPHGGEILNPELSYIVSETVVEDGRLVSDKITERRLIGVKEVSIKPVKLSQPSKPSQPSMFSRVLQRWGILLLDMVCNVDDY